MFGRVIAALACVTALGACAHRMEPAATVTIPTAAEVAPASAHRLFVEAAGCWLGDLWALGVDDVEPPEQRCASTIAHAYGGHDELRWRRLREGEASEVEALARRVREVAWSDPIDSARADVLLQLVRTVGAAQHEQVRARGAARCASSRTSGLHDVDALSSTSALSALFAVDARDLTAEARTIGVILALDHLELAACLPEHLKVLAVQGAVQTLFDLHPPAMTADPEEPLPTGTWLGYLEDVARATGRAVPDFVVRPAYREIVAWGGVLAGVADRLEVEAAPIREAPGLTRAAKLLRQRLEARCDAIDVALLASLLELVR